MEHFGTNAIHAGQDPTQWNCMSVIPPIFATSTFKQNEPGAVEGGYDYTRGGNPTRAALETCVASLESAKYATVYSSGMAACSTVTQCVVKSGDHILCMNDVYGGTNRFFRRILSNYQVEISFVDATDHRKFKAALQPNTSLVWLETPTNPLLSIVDIEAVSALIRQHSSKPVLVIDNTFMSSYFQQPLLLGADVSMQSLTKYMNGHSDVLMGVLCTNREDLAEKFKFAQLAVGAVPSPFDCFLVNRGLKTLHLRMREHEANAMEVALFLENHRMVERIFYPGLKSHPQHELACKQCTGHSGIVTFVMKGTSVEANTFIKSLKIFTLAESLGGYESLVEIPAIMTHKSVPAEQRAALGISDCLIRLSVGLEDAQDILEDLDNAFSIAYKK